MLGLQISILELNLKISNYICWLMKLIDSVLKKDEHYYPQVFLKECKYIEKEKKLIRYITSILKFSSDDSDESDEERIKIKHHVF